MTTAAHCTHSMASGHACQSPAVRGTAFCYHHTTVKDVVDRTARLEYRSYGGWQPLPFVFPEDRASLQMNYFVLMQAFNAQNIDLRTFNAMHRMLRSMAANLGKTSLTESGFSGASEEPGVPHLCGSVTAAKMPSQPEPEAAEGPVPSEVEATASSPLDHAANSATNGSDHEHASRDEGEAGCARAASTAYERLMSAARDAHDEPWLNNPRRHRPPTVEELEDRRKLREETYFSRLKPGADPAKTQ